MTNGESKATLALKYGVAYLLLLLSGALGLWILLLWRSILVSAGFHLQVNPWAIRAIDIWGTFLIGLCWLAAFVYIENYFRVGIQRGGLWRRVARVASIAGIVVASSLLLDWLL